MYRHPATLTALPVPAQRLRGQLDKGSLTPALPGGTLRGQHRPAFPRRRRQAQTAASPSPSILIWKRSGHIMGSTPGGTGGMPVDGVGGQRWSRIQWRHSASCQKLPGHFGLGVDDLVSVSRKRAISVPRQVAMYLLVHEMGLGIYAGGPTARRTQPQDGHPWSRQSFRRNTAKHRAQIWTCRPSESVVPGELFRGRRVPTSVEIVFRSAPCGGA